MIQLAFYSFSTLLILSALAVVFARNPVHSVLFLILAFFNAAGLFVLVGAEFLAMILVIVYVGAVAVLFLFVVMMLRIAPQNQRPIFSKSSFRYAITTIGFLCYYLSLFFFTFVVLASIPVLIDLAREGHFRGEPIQEVAQVFIHSPWLIFIGTKGQVYSLVITLLSGLVARQAAQGIVRRPFLLIAGGFVDSLPFMLALAIVLIVYFAILGWHWFSSPYSEEVVSSPTPPIDLMTNTQALGQVIYSEYVFAFQAAGVILLIAMVGAIILSLRHREGIKRQDIRTQLARSPANTLALKNVPIGKGI